MKKRPPFQIGSTLKHIPTGTIIVLEKYDTQLVKSLGLSIGGGTTKSTPNYNFLYGKVSDSNTSFKGLSSEFELLKTNKAM
ncbi:hypothetical protein [Tenacibaculum larymnensis]|uniref:Uncharacterized protein n=1 Tax=Tenacibaculum larymnensis TaxID=2878201 RepID=A0A9X4IQN7_9FLAO|nr:hypothetical protein [Tenacibaculum larymnensis]MDE1207102.1 hypothetical protein [Tenacibaculum larymnensis]